MNHWIIENLSVVLLASYSAVQLFAGFSLQHMGRKKVPVRQVQRTAGRRQNVF